MSLKVEELDNKIKPLFEKFPHLKENYCAECLGLIEVQPNEEDKNIKNCDIYKMDTGKCSKCGRTNDVVNPLIYSVAKINGFEIYGVANRIYRTKRNFK